MCVCVCVIYAVKFLNQCLYQFSILGILHEFLKRSDHYSVNIKKIKITTPPPSNIKKEKKRKEKKRKKGKRFILKNKYAFLDEPAHQTLSMPET